MSSKEALEKLVSKTSILNDTCASLEDCIKSKKCRFNEPCENCNDYNLVKTILQDLERLEMLEKENEELKNKLKRFIPRIVVRNTFDNVLPSLEEENEKLKTAIKILGDNFPIKFLGYNKYGAKP